MVLDDWVLCRIYKKNSGGQKPISGAPSTEHSHGSSSSCSTQYDDMLESLPEINDRFFTLPRMNSLRTTQHDEKFNLQNLTSGNFDWASLAGVPSLPELVPSTQSQAQSQGHVTNNTGTAMKYNDIYAPTIPPLCQVDSSSEKFGGPVDEEVQSGSRANRVENPGLLFQQNSNGSGQGQGQGFSNSFDPFGIRYPTHQGGFGFRQ
ncbi:NAC domain-containing protein [Sarracenia purpurea var. burkii]